MGEASGRPTPVGESGTTRTPMAEDGGKPTTLLAPPDRPGLFEAHGVEIESMIVDAETLAVSPVCDRLLHAVSDGPSTEVERGELAWSNELVLHVVEFKTNGPAPQLSGLADAFHSSMLDANRTLETMGAKLMPGAVHPLMDPDTETRLWPHEYTEVYHTFDRIFGCSGHGWANLQSTHLNLPFGSDEEFGRLHAAIRLVLPLIPALSAASPYMDGRRAADLDGRLTAYRSNARQVPSVTGRVVPEPVASPAEYQRVILDRIYADLAPMDPDGVLRYEWANARGAIARFDRGAIEIRVIDAQECPASDLAVVAAVTAVVRALADGALTDRDVAADPSTDELADIFDATVRDGDEARVESPWFLRTLGLPTAPTSAATVWRTLLDRYPPENLDPLCVGPLETILSDGPLARRMVDRVGDAPSRESLLVLMEDLCAALERNSSLSVSG